MVKETILNNKAVKFALLLLILVACWYGGRVFNVDVAYYQEFFSKYPLALSGLIFIVLYVVTTTFIWFGPKDVLRISSAILFGPYVSTVFVWIGEMCNAAIMFHLSRILGREYVQQRLGVGSGDLDKMKDDASFLGIAAWRINPLVPFRLMDLGYGLTPVSFTKYFVTIVILSFFRILWLQFIIAGIGTSIFKDASAMMDYFLAHPAVLRMSAFYFLAVIVVTLMAVVGRFLKKKK